MNNYILPNYNRINLNFIRGKGSWLYTKSGKYLDFSSGIAVNCLGHSNNKLIKALEVQANKLWHTSNLFTISVQEKLAKQLCDRSFAEKVFFCNSGAEATEGMVKIIRRYHYVSGNKRRKNIIVFNNAFHGRTVTGIQAGYNKAHRDGFLGKDNCDCGFTRISMNEISVLEKKINSSTAAILFEPIQGEGGINTFTPDFFKK
ncbi:aminotransferase class III-fold pyridoxal phosphate-dependent enzyme, partial [Alphaproteobacteria bacterium]|nr:aminotransferase class III-fold pyridoxal phosphate-dependent enzyme [Alphaproteobacteria bacterium]